MKSIYKILQIGALLIIVANCKNENSKNFFWKDVQLNEQQVYLVFRGTKSKEGFFAKDFNISDTLSSHVGMLINDKTKWEIYHIIDFKDKNRSDFRKQSLKDFFDSKKEDINYVSFWEIDNIDTN